MKIRTVLIVIGVFILCGLIGVMFGTKETPENLQPEPAMQKQDNKTKNKNNSDDGYLNAIDSQSTAMLNSLANIRQLLSNIQSENDDWYIDLLNEVTIVENTAEKAIEMNPSEKFKEAHVDYLEGMNIIKEVAEDLKEIATSFEVDSESMSIIQECPQKLEKAILPIKEATRKIKVIMNK